jgi:hypothetical protein
VRWLAAVPLLALAGLLAMPRPHERVTRLCGEVHSEVVVDGEVSGWVRMARDFRGRAAIVVRGPARLHDLTIEGNGEIPAELPPWNVPFAKFTRGNGILVEGVDGMSIDRAVVRGVAGFAVLVSRSRHVRIENVAVEGAGSRNAAGKNNTTGGILLEEGTSDFLVSGCNMRGVKGNGVWTHSLYTSPRNGPGRILQNGFEEIGRDAVQVGHAFGVTVRGNWGRTIGYPKEIVDAVPAALDTAGNVENSVYEGNRFHGINGKCIDLDGFHDGEVRGNSCKDVGGYGIVLNNTNPDMQSRNVRITGNTLESVMYGGVFVIGAGHTVVGNKLLNLNYSHCDGCGYVPDEPDMLDSGIYLGRKAERAAPARGNAVENNEVTGYKMKARCVGHAPGITAEANTVRGNVCSEPRP